MNFKYLFFGMLSSLIIYKYVWDSKLISALIGIIISKYVIPFFYEPLVFKSKEIANPKQRKEKNKMIPKGWYRIYSSKKLKKGDKKKIYFYSEELLLWRSNSNQLNCISSFCPHLGADLSQGEIVNNKIKCPFHNWILCGDGTCSNVPSFSQENQPSFVEKKEVITKSYFFIIFFIFFFYFFF